MANINFDDSEFQRGVSDLGNSVAKKVHQAIQDVAEEILRLSQFEVPIGETSGLQNSGQVDSNNQDDVIVGYNTVYAAYQHEGMREDGTHVVHRYSNPRSKKKYLEDPIKMNLEVFNTYFAEVFEP